MQTTTPSTAIDIVANATPRDIEVTHTRARTMGAVAVCEAGLGASVYQTQYTSGNCWWMTPAGEAIATDPDGRWYKAPRKLSLTA